MVGRIILSTFHSVKLSNYCLCLTVLSHNSQVGLLYFDFVCPRIRVFTALVRTAPVLVILLILLPSSFAFSKISKKSLVLGLYLHSDR
jgi:hypothetical protein